MCLSFGKKTPHGVEGAEFMVFQSRKTPFWRLGKLPIIGIARARKI
jgi:hypothetical protein